MMEKELEKVSPGGIMMVFNIQVTGIEFGRRKKNKTEV
jgi:hypothetical protein